MGYYFQDRESLSATLGEQASGGSQKMRVERGLRAIIERYVWEHPPSPLTYRAFSRRGILRGADYRYRADFNAFFPDAGLQQYVYAWSRYCSKGASELVFDVSCFGPMVVYLNGKVVFTSDIFSERYPEKRNRMTLAMHSGWNDLVIRFEKTRAGFGGVFGTWLGKHPYYFLTPSLEHAGSEGREGWVFTAPMREALREVPGMRGAAVNALFGYPNVRWTDQEKGQGNFGRVFGMKGGAKAVAWTCARFTDGKDSTYVIRGRHDGELVVSIDDREVYRAKKSGGVGRMDVAVEIVPGRHNIMVVGECNVKGGKWGFEMEVMHRGKRVALRNPAEVHGSGDPWLYIGPFEKSAPVDLKGLRNLNRVHRAAGGATYWRLDGPELWLRPYNDNALYGHWNYPLGVTLYGLLEAGRAIGSGAVERYAADHIRSCIATFDYALWDKGQYGGATSVHHLLSSIDSLDDCGSFGSTMLEAAGRFPMEGYREIAEYIARYISKKQARLPDGGFYRKKLMHAFHEKTMWADDLYMSVPFLVRYAELSGERGYLEDAAKQFLSFKKRLWMPELKLMGHVVDFRRGLATGIPWGRGNGWPLFSLTELLMKMPQGHRKRKELMEFFREFCEGVWAQQDSAGMWHQVLTHADAYPETSCTAMFACAFARGVKHGWFSQGAGKKYKEAAMRAWEGIVRTSIDRGGNVHGVCRGSEFSFSPEYYKKELLPRLNDTHGVGIVLLAGAEVMGMKEK